MDAPKAENNMSPRCSIGKVRLNNKSIMREVKTNEVIVAAEKG